MSEPMIEIVLRITGPDGTAEFVREALAA